MITINLLRISPDSKYLEFNVEVPIEYKFNKLYIKKYDMERLNNNDNLWRDYSYLIQGTTNKEITQISTEAISGLTIAQGASTIFYVQFGAIVDIDSSNYEGRWESDITYNALEIVTYNGKYYSSLDNGNLGHSTFDTSYWVELPLLSDIEGVCSDVNNVYILLKDSLLNLNVNCLNQDNYQTLLRNYMFLYGHIEAMRLERFDEAEMFYDILKQSFTCCTTDRSSNTRNLNNCNCT